MRIIQLSTHAEGIGDFARAHRVLACDPDTKEQALALFERASLSRARMVWCGFWNPLQALPYADALAIEGQVIDERTQEKRVSDIVDLTLATGIAIGRFPGRWCMVTKPEEWKAQNSKPTHHRRLVETFDASDWEIFCAAAGYDPGNWKAYILTACEKRALAKGKTVGYSRKGVELLDSIGIGKRALNQIQTSGRATR